jgi:Kef-type K+ transport system membrane component KefB
MALEVLDEIGGDTWFQVATLFAVAIASSMLFVRLGLPKTVGWIVVGIIIGPGALNLIELQGSTDTDVAPLDPEGKTDLITLLATFGSTIMLFIIGLECDFKEIYTRKNISIAIGGITLPWIGGYALAEFLLPGGTFAQSIFIATALVATSVAITASVLKEMGILSSGIAKAILGAAIVDDVLGMIVLAITAGIGTGHGVELLDISWIAIAAILFVVLGTYLGIRVFVKVIGSIERYGLKRGLPESGFLVALSFAFMYAFVSHQIGISAIVGAFVAGTAFSQCEYRRQFREGIVFLEWAFAPIFFISLGILVNINLPVDMWVFAVALAGVAILTKVVGSAIPARLYGMSTGESVAVGLGMAARLEVAMIIAVYGLSENIIDTTVYSVIVVMGVISILIAPTLLRIMGKRITKPGNGPIPESCEI